MSYPNPYAAPREVNPFGEVVPMHPMQQPGVAMGLWRQGNVLVMHKAAPLPDICLKSNLPATRRLKRTMYWHHPAIFLTILLSVLIYIILVLCLRKKAVIHIPLTDEWFARRRMRILVAWCIAAVGAVAFVAGVMVADHNDLGVLFILLGVVLVVAGALVGSIGGRLVYPSRITDEYAWIKGVNREYLDRLPVWPYHI
jgi:hypothetical protein